MEQNNENRTLRNRILRNTQMERCGRETRNGNDHHGTQRITSSEQLEIHDFIHGWVYFDGGALVIFI